MAHKKQKKKTAPWLLLIIAFASILISVKVLAKPTEEYQIEIPETPDKGPSEDLKQQAFSVLKNKCNTCHVKKNPFMIFTEKNMTKRAPRIKKQVFELNRMPKKNGVPLTQEEYITLKTWIGNK